MTPQQEVAWTLDHVYAPRPLMRPSGLHALPDGGAMVVGVAWSGAGAAADPAEVVLSKVDENGDLRWTTALPLPPVVVNPGLWQGQFVDSAVSSAGQVYVLSLHAGFSMLSVFDANGVSLWTQRLDPLTTLPVDWFAASHLAVGPMGDVVVAGSAYVALYPQLFVYAYTAQGVPLWTWSEPIVGSVPRGVARGVVRGSSGESYVFGQIDFWPGQTGPGEVHAFSPTGALLWRVVLGSIMNLTHVARITLTGSGDLLVLTNNSYFPLADAFNLHRLTPSGALVYNTDTLSFPFVGRIAHDVAVTSAGEILVAGGERPAATPLYVPYEPALFRFDSQGSFLGTLRPSVVAPGVTGQFFEVVVTPMGDFLALGALSDPGAAALVARIRPDGTEVWSRTFSGLYPSFQSPYSAQQGLPGGTVDVDVTFDPRGNVFLSSEQRVSANATAMRVTKLLEGGTVGSTYCAPATPNSTGMPAALHAFGAPVVSTDNLTLLLAGLPPGTFCLLLTSRAQGSVPGAGGSQGTLCLGGAIGRYIGPGQVRRARTDGTAALQLDFARMPQPTGLTAALAGETWHFQGWYRDANPGLTSNLTSAVAVPLQ